MSAALLVAMEVTVILASNVLTRDKEFYQDLWQHDVEIFNVRNSVAHTLFFVL